MTSLKKVSQHFNLQISQFKLFIWLRLCDLHNFKLADQSVWNYLFKSTIEFEVFKRSIRQSVRSYYCWRNDFEENWACCCCSLTQWVRKQHADSLSLDFIWCFRTRLINQYIFDKSRVERKIFFNLNIIIKFSHKLIDILWSFDA